MHLVYFNLFLLGVLTSLGLSKPIMVSFGTNDGPILPPPTTTTLRPNLDVNPAPVFERREDVPNPSIYKPIGPNQYRLKIYSHKPNPNLILGTPLDIKYGPNLNKYSHKKRQIKSLGIGYRGPQVFDKQDYEDELDKQMHTFSQESEQYNSYESQYNENKRVVPQIGIVYSSGLRYYVPQIVDYNEEENNSVYDRSDAKYNQQTNRDYYY